MSKTKNNKQKSHGKRTFKQKLIRFFFQIVFVLIAIILLFIASVKMGFYGKIPTQQELKAFQNMEASEVYSADGKLLGKFYLQDRSAVAYSEISPNVINALVATEDARFFQHDGVDYRSLLRVLFRTVILQDRSGGGGSTITQQLVKNIFGREEYKYLSMPITKLKEIFTAKRLENTYSKQQIITLYLNTVPFGDNTFGIESAAQRFFSTSSNNLSVPQAATLIGMLKANYSYNPRLFPDKSRFRRNIVINQMEKYGYLTPEEANTHKNELLNLNYQHISHEEGIATYFREQVRQRALKWCEANKKDDGTSYNLYRDGLKIYTTIDSRLQEYAEKAMRKHMAALQQTFDKHISGNEPWRTQDNLIESAKIQSERYKTMLTKGYSIAEIERSFRTKTTMDIFTWEGEKEVNITPIDSIKHYLKFLNTGFLAVHPSSGQVKAWVGGIDFKYFKYDHVNYTMKRQVGSTFKPIVYAAALEKGIEPCEYISAEKIVYENYDNWTPTNGEDNYDLKYSMEGALTKSVNTVAVNLIDQTGIKKVINLAKAIGVESELPDVPSLALGVANLSVSELASVYSSFANKGQSVKPYTIERIVNSEGKEVYKNAFKPNEKAYSDATATIMLNMMQNVVDSGTASRLRWKYHLPNDIAGKTGTTQNNTDGWFAAITPELVMISWVGADNPSFHFQSTVLGQGANTALPITAEFLKLVNSDPSLNNISKAKFPEPSAAIKSKLDCMPEIDGTTFIQKIFGKRDEPIKKEFGDSLTNEKKTLRDRIKGLFNRKK